ncbi:hypothetical protein EJB05_41362, partial [Eragrostis curvula]
MQCPLCSLRLFLGADWCLLVVLSSSYLYCDSGGLLFHVLEGVKESGCPHSQCRYPYLKVASHGTPPLRAVWFVIIICYSIPSTCLRKCFGYSSFRPHQKTVIEKELDGVDCLVVMATGSGKSICYQIPPLVRHQTAVVISPLLSLMQDQVMSLKQKGIKSEYLASTQTNASVCKNAEKGAYDVLYMTPEKAIALPNSFWQSLMKSGICLFAVDEAHCISEWGHDFRVVYKQLNKLRTLLTGVPFVALTATATDRVRADIVSSLALRDPHAYIGTFDRPNLFYGVKLCDRSDSFTSELAKDIQKKCTDGESTIIYCTTIKDTEQIFEALSSNGIKCGVYHGQMDAKSREKSHKSFIRDEFHVMVATIAFGMGIDKPDIRCVIHYGCPKSLESYYQESGRCGRDGLPLVCWSYYNRADFTKGDFYCQDTKSAEQRTQIIKSYVAAQNYCTLTTCRRRHLLDYFGEELDYDCGNCDNCNDVKKERDYGEEALMLMECICACGGKWGLNVPISVLRGSKCRKVRENKLDQLDLHGAGKQYPQKWWKALGTMLVSKGFIIETVRDTFRLLRVSQKGQDFITSCRNQVRPSLVLQLTLEMEEFEDMSDGDSVEHSTELNMRDDKINLSKEELVLYHLLLTVRVKIAQDTSVAPYAICGDLVLRSIARFRPSNVEGLALIDGVNQNFIGRYGTIFLLCLKDMARDCGLGLDNWPEDLEHHNEEDEDTENNAVLDMGKLEEKVLDYVTCSDGISLDDIKKRFPEVNHVHVEEAVTNLQASFYIYIKDGLYVTQKMECRSSLTPWDHARRRTSRRRRHYGSEDESSDGLSDPEQNWIEKGFVSHGHVSSIIHQFDHLKKDLVKEIGFGGLLSLPQLGDVDKDFVVWLMRKVRWWSGHVEFDEDETLEIIPEFVQTVVGIPCGGIDVVGHAFKNIDQKVDFIGRVFGNQTMDTKIIEAAEETVQALLPSNASKTSTDNFKVAFVIWVMSRLLAPNKKNKYGNSDIWGALADADQISKFDWSSYVVVQLLESARMLQWAHEEKKDVTKYLSCAFILQVIYLDNIDVGSLKLKHNIFPRVCTFGVITTNQLIKADRKGFVSTDGESQYGCNKLRKQVDSCYTFGGPNVNAYNDEKTYPKSIQHTLLVASDSNLANNKPNPPLDSTFGNALVAQSLSIVASKHNIPLLNLTDVDNSLIVTHPATNATSTISPHPNYIGADSFSHPYETHLQSCPPKFGATGHFANRYTVPASNNTVQAKSFSAPVVSSKSQSKLWCIQHNASNSTMNSHQISASSSLGNVRPSFVPRHGSTQSPFSGNTTGRLNNGLIDCPMTPGPSGLPDFSAYLRIKYQDKVDNTLLDAMRQHNARCLMHETKFKNELAAAIIYENICLADKFMDHLLKNNSAPVQKSCDRRRTFDDFRNGPESANDGINAQLHATPTGKPPRSINQTLVYGGQHDTIGNSSMQSHDIVCPNQLGLKTHLDGSQMRECNTANCSDQAYLQCADTPIALKTLMNEIPIPISLCPEDDKLFNTPAADGTISIFTPSMVGNKEKFTCPETGLAVARISGQESIHPNLLDFDDESCASEFPKTTVSPGIFALSPWVLGYKYPEKDYSVRYSFYKWLSSSSYSEVDSIWIRHESPRIIELSGRMLKRQLCDGIETGYDLFDISIRRLKQLDSFMQHGDDSARWRHLLESDYATKVLYSQTVKGDKSAREQFAGSQVNYDISHMRREEIFILDPSAGSNLDSMTLVNHKESIDKIHSSLIATITDIFDGWIPNWDGSKRTVVRIGKEPCKSVESAFVTLYCIKNFDGQKIVADPSPVSMQSFKEYLLYELLDIKGNRGKKPDVYVETIDD